MTHTSGEKAFLAYSRLLTQLGRVDLPLAVRGTLNKAAFESRKHLSEVEMPKAFTLRNRFENKQSLHYERVPGGEFNIGNMKSSIGQMRVVRFQRGPKPTSDLLKQEIGGTLTKRPGSSRMRTATKDARVGKSFGRVVAKRYRPTAGANWAGLKEIEGHLGRNAHTYDNGDKVPLIRRLRRAHMIRIANADNLGKDAIYTLPLIHKPNVLGVFQIINGKPTMLHKLEKKTKKLKVRKTVQPTMAAITPKVGEFFVEQADRRVKKAALKVFGL